MRKDAQNIDNLSGEDKRALLTQLLQEKKSEPKMFPMSYAQQRLWFLDQLAPGNPFYNIPAALPLLFDLNTSVLESSINEIIRRHESLRTSFSRLDSQPVQLVSPSLRIPLTLSDLRHLPHSQRQTEASLAANHEAQASFDLSRLPLIRARLLWLGPRDYLLLITMHHIVSDGWSMDIFWNELSVIYSALASGRASPLPDLAIQYADYAVWQRQWLQGEVLDQQLDYWRQQLADLPLLQMPTDRKRPAVQTFRGAYIGVELGERVTRKLRAMSQREGVTLFMSLLTGFKSVLMRYSGQSDIVVGTPIAGRNRAETEPLIGFFINSLVMRTDLSGEPSFKEALRRVKQTAVGAYGHQDLPFEMLVEHLQPYRDLSRNPLFQVIFQLISSPKTNNKPTGSNLPSIEVRRGTAIFDIALSLWENPDSLTGGIEFCTDLFDHQTISRLFAHFARLLEAAADDIDSPLLRLPLLSQPELDQLLSQFNSSGGQPPPDLCLHDLFQATARHHPDSLALVFDGQSLSYSALNRRANCLAHYLAHLGARPESLVGICMRRSVEMVVAVLGVLKAGAAYVPLDPDYPRQRLEYMFEDAGAEVVLTQAEVWKGEWAREAKVVKVDEQWEEISGYGEQDYESGVSGEGLAYMIYTSGSTGRPKGVMISHRGLSNVVEEQRKTFKLGPGDRMLQLASLSFDASIFEIAMAFGAGAALYLGAQESLMPGEPLYEFLRDNSITAVTLTPSALAALPVVELPALQTITVAGEACGANLAKQWGQGRNFFNLYGPTEGSIWATFADCIDEGQKPPIGRPISNTEIYVLDTFLQPTPIGVPGQLFLAGLGLARGYLNRPDLSALKFIPHPFSKLPGARLYATGDAARFLADGSLEYLGRIDHQVKVRGYRIELGEIEAVLSELAGGCEAVVVAREDVPGDIRLVAYMVLREGAAPSPGELRSLIREKLPEYMVPSSFVMLDGFPLMPSGKVDRQALVRMEKLGAEMGAIYVAPQTQLEQAIATVWQEMLHLEKVGTQDNFFDLGGHSLLLTQAYSKLKSVLDKEVTVMDMFKYPTINSLAKHLSQERDKGQEVQQILGRAGKQKEAISRRKEMSRRKTK